MPNCGPQDLEGQISSGTALPPKCFPKPLVMTPFAGVDVAHLLASRALPPCCPGGRIMFKQTSSLQALALFTHSTKIRAVLLLPVPGRMGSLGFRELLAHTAQPRSYFCHSLQGSWAEQTAYSQFPSLCTNWYFIILQIKSLRNPIKMVIVLCIIIVNHPVLIIS